MLKNGFNSTFYLDSVLIGSVVILSRLQRSYHFLSSVERHVLGVVVDPSGGSDCITHARSLKYFVTLYEELKVTVDASFI